MDESDKTDKTEIGLQPVGGDDRYKVIMILLRSHRLVGTRDPNERGGRKPG